MKDLLFTWLPGRWPPIVRGHGRGGLGAMARGAETVEAWFEGTVDVVETLLSWCREGPEDTSPKELAVDWGAPLPASLFEVR